MIWTETASSKKSCYANYMLLLLKSSEKSSPLYLLLVLPRRLSLFNTTYIIFFGSTPEISPTSVAGNVQHSYALQAWKGDVLSITL